MYYINAMTKAKNQKTLKIVLEPEDNYFLVTLCGQYNQNLQQIEKYLDIEIQNRGNEFFITGDKEKAKQVEKLLIYLYDEIKAGKVLSPEKIHYQLRGINVSHDSFDLEDALKIYTPKMCIVPHTKNQVNYINNILQNDVNFGVGPAGTGKTYLAVACAVSALEKEQVERIVLVRPVVEAGEHLGFLPGDIAQKIDPYLRPLYDALYDMLGARQVEKLIAEHIIEIAPLAFMRGRTLNASFIILDESQNTTVEQMKMFLTRIGFGSKAVITGDITQIDLSGKISGLINAKEILQNISGISFSYFDPEDVVRHPLVQNIIQAYDHFKKKNVANNNSKTAKE